MENWNHNIRVGFHYGRTLLHLADTYSRPVQVILEMVQNAIDADCKNIYIKVDNSKKYIYCADDGKGESYSNLQRRFERIGERQKEKKIGHKGIGNLACLAIAETSCLTTRPKDSGERFCTISLSRSGLENQSEPFDLPCALESDSFRPGVNFRLGSDFRISTLLIAKKVKTSANKLLNDTAMISRGIEDKFATQIIQKDIRIIIETSSQRINVKPSPYPGEKQETILKTKLGDVKFEMYVLNKPERKPRLHVVHGKSSEEFYSIPFTPFINVSPVVKEVFGSGYLQGNIFLPFCTITPDREDLEFDDELSIFWDCIEKYSQDFGMELLNKLSEEKKELKIFLVLNNALKKASTYLKKNNELKNFFSGIVSPGHIGYESGIDTENVRTKKQISYEHNNTTNGKTPLSEKKGIVHTGIVDYSGSKRRVVNRQVGLYAEYRNPVLEEGMDWRCKREGRVIVFNCMHQDWLKAETNSEIHTNYCFHLILKEIVLVKIGDFSENTSIFFNQIFEDEYMPMLLDTSISSSQKHQ